MEKARQELAEQQQRKERLLAKERERAARREWWRRPTTNTTHTWVRTAPRRDTTIPTLTGTQVEQMDVEEGAGVDLSLETITLTVGEHDHLLEGQDPAADQDGA